MTRNRAAAAAAALLALAACDGGGLLGGGAGETIDAQYAHPNGVVVQVDRLAIGGERTRVDLRVLNGRDREIRLNRGTENSYLLTDGGEKLLLVAPPANAALAVPGGRAADLSLVFAGALPRSGTATLILNEGDTADGEYSSNPRIELSLPLDRAGSGSIAETSSMANIRPVPASSLRAAAGGGSTLGTGAQGESSLARVDALKSELGAVETERGTVVSLPGDVTFDFNEATIRADARPTLDRVAELIGASEGTGSISIEGHSDSRGDDAYNRKLSQARAEAVKAYLVEKGVATERLATLGLGETRPVAPNAKADGTDDEAGRQRNRRVEVILPGAARATPAGGPGTAPTPAP